MSVTDRDADAYECLLDTNSGAVTIVPSDCGRYEVLTKWISADGETAVSLEDSR